MILETKLDESFLKDQFLIKGFSEPYRLDRNSKGGGIILFIREDIPSKLSIEKNSIKTFYEEVNLQKIEWLLCCFYNPNKNNIYADLEISDRSLICTYQGMKIISLCVILM